MNLPFLKNDITNNLGLQKPVVNCSTHKFSSGCDIVLCYLRKFRGLILGRYCRYHRSAISWSYLKF